ncbi:tol-pal system protein YbgF [Oleispirillum naphthae]|uniref:tol-pal system protein YbgF n=1 Tax=Oleispirillum naphthae TaxID=2838853 RepID=UPI00308220E6
MIQGVAARMRRSILTGVFAAVGVLAVIGIAPAQDAGSLASRLERVERDLQVLQRQLYRDQAGGGGEALSPDASASLFVRIGQMEEQMRDLTGQIEDLSYKIDQNKERMERMQADIDFRLQPLEKSAPPGAAAAEPPPPAAAGTAPKPAPAPAQLGRTAPSQPLPPPPAQSAEDAYRAARSLLLKADYAAAEVAFKDFLKAHGDSEFAGNAQYWLGETYYVRGQFEQAAIAFADGYKKFRKGSKAPDSLFKLGFSMRKLNQSDKACAAFDQLLKEYPGASKAVLDLARKTRTELKCR